MVESYFFSPARNPPESLGVGNFVVAFIDAGDGLMVAVEEEHEGVVEVDFLDFIAPDGVWTSLGVLVAVGLAVPVEEDGRIEFAEERLELRGRVAIRHAGDLHVTHVHGVEVFDGVDGVGLEALWIGPQDVQCGVDHVEGVAAVVDDDVEGTVLFADFVEEVLVELRPDLDFYVLLQRLGPLALCVNVDADVPQLIPVVLAPDSRRAPTLHPDLEHLHRIT
mmetsp:Transcript_24626/g.79601  ORF Transcript_24626/g.79601 Transcript_24626/m.79601 type:complete len:221 (-) Transcript_24626:193-855(-)